MSIRFGSKPSCYRKVATVCNEGMPKNDRKDFDFKPNGGGNRLRASCVHNVTGGNEILAEEVASKDNKAQCKVVL